ncbi:hypothetical protein JCGZ_25287 [Jatropha curcas]|uniref:Aminotransferase-like plant mobile domain-containing protein n=1 Tax=Jatropha curcas TaxID=180498 RepID=A0A067JXT8_JATCU|nr:hypothetical protein JCGZ_25287 [Jatropha curcas]
MTSSGHSSDEDFLESLGISLDTDLTADADTHASVTVIGCLVSAEGCPVVPRPETILLGRESGPSDKRLTFCPLSPSRGHASGQVWLKDHLRVVAAPTFLPYNPSQYRMRRILITHPSTDAWTSLLIELGPDEVLWQMGIDQTVPIVDGTSVDSVITPGVTRAILKAWVRDHHMVRPLPNPASVHTSPEYQTWFIAAVWPIERPRRIALLSALEGRAQVGTDDADGTDEEIVMAPQTGEVGEGLAPKDDIEDVAPHEAGESLAARDDSEDITPRRRRAALCCSMRFWMSASDAIWIAGEVVETGEASEAGEVGDSTVGVTGTWIGTRIVGTCKDKGNWIKVQWVVFCIRGAECEVDRLLCPIVHD